jgi:hypothetical protein
MYLQKVISKKNITKFFCWFLEDHGQKDQDPEPDPLVGEHADPDPYQIITDPGHWKTPPCLKRTTFMELKITKGGMNSNSSFTPLANM